MGKQVKPTMSDPPEMGEEKELAINNLSHIQRSINHKNMSAVKREHKKALSKLYEKM